MPPAEKWIILLIIVGMAIVFSLFGLVFAWVGGWGQLARAFPKIHSPGARRFLMRSASFGQVNYGNCLMLSVDDIYLHVSILFPFRAGHAPMSIPWAETRMRPVRFFLVFKGLEITFPKVPGVKIRMTIPLAMKLIRTAREMGLSNAPEIPDEPVIE
jgi:hypothetical protein